MGRFVFITGGVRSGKSGYAVERAKAQGKNIVYIATCTPLDGEMKKRVSCHRKSRPETWKTIEEPLDLVSALEKVPKSADAAIIDCLTLWISNLLFAGRKETAILAEAHRLAKHLRDLDLPVMVVSNEVGSGIVPENALARAFRDIAGRVNQIMASTSDETVVTISGIPLRLKGS